MSTPFSIQRQLMVEYSSGPLFNMRSIAIPDIQDINNTPRLAHDNVCFVQELTVSLLINYVHYVVGQ